MSHIELSLIPNILNNAGAMAMSYRIKEKRYHEQYGEVNTGQKSVIIPKLINLEHWMHKAGVETLK